jgi:DNA-binding transcriptional ArsR family regulator
MVSNGQTPLLVSILEIPNLSSGARRALTGLYSFRNKKTGSCCPRIATLCERLGAPYGTVRRWLRELRVAGVVEMAKHRGSNAYVFHRDVFHSVEKFESVHKSGRSTASISGRSGGPYPLYEQTKGNIERIPPQRSLWINARAPTMDDRVLAAYYEEQRRKAGG